MRAALERCARAPRAASARAGARRDLREDGVTRGTERRVAADWARVGGESRYRSARSSGSARELIRAYQWRGLMRCELGRPRGDRGSRARARRGDRAPHAARHPAYVNLADQVWRQRGPAAALEIQSDGHRVRRRRGGAPTWPQAESCWMLYDLGRWDELLRRRGGGIRQFEETHGAAQPGAMAQTYAALVLIRRGDLDRGAARWRGSARAAQRDRRSRKLLGPALVASAL